MPPVEHLATRIYSELAASFPICCASDEFYFFPQVVSDSCDWRIWDDVTPARINAVTKKLLDTELQLRSLKISDLTASDATDAELLRTVLRTLREQLIDVAPQRNQPTFHLTILVAGLSEALEADTPNAFEQRLAGVPDFLQRAGETLAQIPTPFLALGRQMLAEIRAWLQQPTMTERGTAAALEALDRFAARQEELPRCEDFTLPPELFSRLIREHLCCGIDPDQVRQVLEQELGAMDEILQTEAAQLAPGRRWQELESRIPFIEAPDGELLALYRPEIERLERHTLDSGLLPDFLERPPQPQLKPVPDHLLAIRASDAYSARPGHPARGGTFFVYPRRERRAEQPGRTLEYRMTAAHETWPGHHLLDLCRWSLPSPVRRPIERPLYYEGWACLAEELLARTGYFDGPWDRFLLARRRIERAARGLIDLGLQGGHMKFTDAARKLVDVGYAYEQARAAVYRYSLRPGYQVCYTLGLKRALELLDRCRTPSSLAQIMLREGQLDFTSLMTCLNMGEDC